MRFNRLRERTWRYYRNWLIAAAAWLAVFFSAWQVYRAWQNLLWTAPILLFCWLIIREFRYTHPRVSLMMLQTTPEDAGLPYETVEFPSRDGLTLFGWFIPGWTDAGIIMVHGFGSRGIHLLTHALALAKYGYNILLFDLRAHGSSGGDTTTGGWLEPEDLLGAVDYLQAREEVDPDKIAAFGISFGALISLRTAAQSEAIRGVVAEGAGPVCLADLQSVPKTFRRRLFYPLNWFTYKLQSFMNGQQPPAGMLVEIGRIAPRPILIITAGRKSEQYWGRRFYEAAKEPKELWEIPEARHAAGFLIDHEKYVEKMVALFEKAFGAPADEEVPPAEQGGLPSESPALAEQ
jgi:pimeloyl-ACP methyl ester carboxylesterase